MMSCLRQHILQRGERRFNNTIMRFNFKKISALTTSALLVGMTAGVAGIAAAATYPAPFVEGGASDVAIVVGTGAGVSVLDGIQASKINDDLHSRVGGVSSGTSSSVSGEAYPLFTSSSKIYINDSINGVRTTLTKTELPTVLADGDFDGDVSADFTQLISLKTSRLKFGQYPTGDEDPIVSFVMGEDTATNPVYNMTVTFNPTVNFTNSDSVGESFTVFGREYTVGASTTQTNLYLYESSETIALSIGGDDPSSATIEVGGETYTVNLVSASDTDATIKVTDSSGASQTKTISEDNSKKVQGIDIAVDLADETTNYGLKAQITVGANKVKLTHGSKVKVGSDEDSIDGTLVYRAGATWKATTGFTVAVAAEDGDNDAISEGGIFTDPVFGTFKIDFSSLAGSDDTESIKVAPSGSGKATLDMTNHKGYNKKIDWFNNDSATARLSDTTSSDNIIVREGARVNVSQYVVVGNEDEGYLLELTDVDNSTDDTDDTITFKDVFSEDTYDVTGITTEGTGDLIVGGKTYTVQYFDSSSSANRYVTIDYPDSATAQELIFYPTVETSKGAKVALYEPLTFSLGAYNTTDATDVAGLQFPDGDGYTDVAVSMGTGGNATFGNWSVAGTNIYTGTVYAGLPRAFQEFKIGEIWYNLSATNTTANFTTLYLLGAANATLVDPGIVIFEEQDDSTSKAYNALIVRMDNYTTSTDKAGVDRVEFTWGTEATDFTGGTSYSGIQLESDDDMYGMMDYWGTKVLYDKSDTDQYSVEITYPDEQLHAEVYVGEESATITPGTSGGVVSNYDGVVVTDKEVASQSAKNLIVLGGSCINSAAATLVGSGYCGTDWTDATGVGPGQFLIKGYASTTLTSKMAVLVAGYGEQDTVNAATYLRTQTPDTSKEYKGTSSTSAEMVVEGTTTDDTTTNETA